MNFLRGFIIFWFFVIVLGIFFFNHGYETNMTGYIPFTGVLKEDPGQTISFPTLNISFDIYRSKINKLWDLDFWIAFEYDSFIKNNIDLEYLILDKGGNLIYSDRESFLLEGDSRIERNLDTPQVQKLGLESGDYIFILKTDYQGKIESFKRNFEIDKISDFLYSLKQLFDIKLEVDTTEFNDLNDFSARVIFESFGSEPTPVNLTFFIYDLQERQVYKKTDSIVVETEFLLVENFEDLELNSGKYNLVLRTLYNIDIEDYFEQPFEYKKRTNLFPFILVGIIILLALFFIFRDKLFGKK